MGIDLYNNGRFRNKLVAQTIVLMLNTRMDVTLGELYLDGMYMTVQNASGCDVSATPTGNPKVYTIPQSVLTYLGSNNRVYDLIDLANDALCGAYVPTVGTPTLTDIRKALEALNSGFDDCSFLLGFSNTLRDASTLSMPTSDEPIAVLAYPNPFNSNTNIAFSVNESSDNVKVEVFNTIGERIATLFNGTAEAGVTYNVEFKGDNMPSGIYTYRVISGSNSFNDKLMLIK